MISRRFLFGAIGASIVAPIAAKLEPFIPTPIKKYIGYPSLSEIVTTTLRTRSGELAENIRRNNALLEHLMRKDGTPI